LSIITAAAGKQEQGTTFPHLLEKSFSDRLADWRLTRTEEGRSAALAAALRIRNLDTRSPAEWLLVWSRLSRGTWLDVSEPVRTTSSNVFAQFFVFVLIHPFFRSNGDRNP